MNVVSVALQLKLQSTFPSFECKDTMICHVSEKAVSQMSWDRVYTLFQFINGYTQKC